MVIPLLKASADVEVEPTKDLDVSFIGSATASPTRKVGLFLGFIRKEV